MDPGTSFASDYPSSKSQHESSSVMSFSTVSGKKRSSKITHNISTSSPADPLIKLDPSLNLAVIQPEMFWETILSGSKFWDTLRQAESLANPIPLLDPTSDYFETFWEFVLGFDPWDPEWCESQSPTETVPVSPNKMAETIRIAELQAALALFEEAEQAEKNHAARSIENSQTCIEDICFPQPTFEQKANDSRHIPIQLEITTSEPASS